MMNKDFLKAVLANNKQLLLKAEVATIEGLPGCRAGVDRLRAAIIVAVHARAVGIVLMALIAVAIVLARARPRVGVRELLLQLADAVLLRV